MIEIQDLYKYYGDRRAIGPLTVTIQPGEIVGLLGLNGAGKTTTLRILACDLMPTSGSVKVGGFDVVANPDAVRARTGYLPDRPPLYDDMSVVEYLRFAAQLRGVGADQLRRRVDDVLELTELGSVGRQMIGTLSHGYRQRVGIAQAIVHRPEFVVLDEPISGLDPVQIVEMRELVRGLRGEHTVIVSSHILTEISETCDRILVISDGSIAWGGTEKQLFAEFGRGMQVAITTLGAPPARVEELLRAVPGVARVDLVAPSEPGDGVVTALLSADSEIRDLACRSLVNHDVAVLEVVRRQGLENMILKLLGGGDAQQRRGRKRNTESHAAETEPVGSGTSSEGA